MSNVIYPKAKEALLSGSIDFTSDDIRVVLVDGADYTYSSTDEFLSDIASAARVSVSGSLTGKTVVNGVFDAADITLSSVTGDQSEMLVIYKHTGVDATSNLLVFMDTGVTGIPITPNGGDIIIAWNGSGIFEL